MKIVLIGAGNLATHLGKALHAAGHDMVQVFSRTMQSAETLASLLDAEPLTDMAQVRDDADVYIFSVKDSALDPEGWGSEAACLQDDPHQEE